MLDVLKKFEEEGGMEGPPLEEEEDGTEADLEKRLDGIDLGMFTINFYNLWTPFILTNFMTTGMD